MQCYFEIKKELLLKKKKNRKNETFTKQRKKIAVLHDLRDLHTIIKSPDETSA